MKSIRFDKQSIDAILAGRKTVTRRLANGKPCRYRCGETLYVAERWRQPEKDARLFVEVVSVSIEPMCHINAQEIEREGYPFDGRGPFPWWRDRWNSIHREPGTRHEDNPDVYRIKFKVVEPTGEEQK